MFGEGGFHLPIFFSGFSHQQLGKKRTSLQVIFPAVITECVGQHMGTQPVYLRQRSNSSALFQLETAVLALVQFYFLNENRTGAFLPISRW